MTNEWNGKTKVNNKWNYEKTRTIKILKNEKQIINEIIEKRNKQRYRNKQNYNILYSRFYWNHRSKQTGLVRLGVHTI